MQISWYQSQERARAREEPIKSLSLNRLMMENCSSPSPEIIIYNPPSQVELEEPSARDVPEVVNISPIERIKMVEFDEPTTKSGSFDTTQPHDSLKVEDASFGYRKCREVSSDRKIETNGNRALKTDSTNGGTDKRIPARSHLYQICAAKKWKLPLYECCKEEGPSHMRMFTFKVTVVIDEASKTVLECFGAPQSKKKAAAEHAAEGALWYLKHRSYYSKDR